MKSKFKVSRQIIIQHIKTIWTKQSRGMPVAGKRNTVPEVMGIPGYSESSDGVFAHSVLAKEQNNFEMANTTRLLSQGLKGYWQLKFQPDDDLLGVQFTYNPNNIGLPERRGYNNTRIFGQKPGKGGMLHIN